jgi:hypothetical protein
MLHMVRFRGPGLTLERERSTGDELRRSEEKPGAPKVGGGHGVIGGPWRAFGSAMNQSGHSTMPPFTPINRDVIYPPDYRRFWMALTPVFHG